MIINKLLNVLIMVENIFAEKAKVSEWVAHDNAIFDICWIKVPICLSCVFFQFDFKMNCTCEHADHHFNVYQRLKYYFM